MMARVNIKILTIACYNLSIVRAVNELRSVDHWDLMFWKEAAWDLLGCNDCHEEEAGEGGVCVAQCIKRF